MPALCHGDLGRGRGIRWIARAIAFARWCRPGGLRISGVTIGAGAGGQTYSYWLVTVCGGARGFSCETSILPS